MSTDLLWDFCPTCWQDSKEVVDNSENKKIANFWTSYWGSCWQHRKQNKWPTSWQESNRAVDNSESKITVHWPPPGGLSPWEAPVSCWANWGPPSADWSLPPTAATDRYWRVGLWVVKGGGGRGGKGGRRERGEGEGERGRETDRQTERDEQRRFFIYKGNANK